MQDIQDTNHSSNLKKSYSNSCCCLLCPEKYRKRRRKSELMRKSLAASEKELKQNEDLLYYRYLPGALCVGTCVIISGYIRPECTRFAVNFECFDVKRHDVAFHFNPRLSQRYFVRNARFHGVWDEEETTTLTKFDLKRNTNFEILVFCTEYEFLTSVNGKHVCGFVYRTPVNLVTRICVEGAVDVHNVVYRKVDSYPLPSPHNVTFSIPVGPGEAELADQQLEVPLTAELPQGFKKNWQLEICGRVKILPFGFYINLQQGSQVWPHPEIPLHLNPRFQSTHGNAIVVCNNWTKGSWKKEQQASGLHFIPGSGFIMAIRNYDDHFSIWIDGTLVGEFKYRNKANIDTVFIYGDVNVNSLYMKTNIDDACFQKNDNRSKECESL